jgi:hypothetical protein
MIIFYCKKIKIGGAESLIVNLVTQLCATGNKVKLFAYHDSFIYKKLSQEGVDFEFKDLSKIKTSNISDYVRSDDVLIWFLFLTDVFYFKNANPRILVWNIFPSDFNNLNRFVFINFKYFTKSLIKQLYHDNAIVFMDKTGIDNIKKIIKLDITNEMLLPVPVPECRNNNFVSNKSFHGSQCFQVTYIGRGVIWKYYPCIKILSDLSNTNGRISFHIVSQDIDYYRNRISKENIVTNNVDIHYHDDLDGKELSNFLLQNSDLHISMGTSCLEGGRLGVPSLLIDASYFKMPESYKYRWIFETENYCLGEVIGKHDYNFKGEDLGSIIYKLQREKEYAINISEKCFSYVNRNHSLPVIAKSFLKIAENANTRVDDVLKYSMRDNPLLMFIKKH